MRARRRRKQRERHARKPQGLFVFPGLELEQAEEQALLDAYCIETECRLADREWDLLAAEILALSPR